MENRDDISSSSSSLNYDGISTLGTKSLKHTSINQAEEFIKDLNKLDNLIGFKQLIGDFEIEIPEEILIETLKLLSDASSFEFYSEITMIRLEAHLRTWMLYKHLNDFVDIHYKMINGLKKGAGNNFKSKGKYKEIFDDDIYIHFQNYNINFLLIHLRDTLLSMSDDETRMDEILRRIKEFFLKFIHISPNDISAKSKDISGTLNIAEILPDLTQVFNYKFPITYWHPTWRELLSIHYLLENLNKFGDYSKLRFYNEIYLFELFWQYIFNLNINQKINQEILHSKKEILEFMNLWMKKEPLAPPNSFLFGILDLVQHLSQRATQIVSLALCYCFGLELLQNSKCNYICFKSLELLFSLSQQKPELLEEIVQDDINKYKESLSTTSRQILEKIIHDVTRKLQFKLKLDQSKELTCPITKQITGDFLILTCGHSISRDAINKWKEVVTIEKRLFVCPFCKNKIELDSTYSLPKNNILDLYKKLEQEDSVCFDKLSEERQIFPNEIYTVEDDLFLKFNQYKTLQKSKFSKLFAQIFQKFQKIQPKFMSTAFIKAAKAEKQKDYSEVVMLLTQVLQLYPKSYSNRCRRAFAFYRLKMYSKAKDDLDTAIQVKPLSYCQDHIISIVDQLA
ncbi:31286_t:CDS:2 [Gigaspora margarita]|uniref:31286_t:CDS:1 n=1 Tax=Gigaspora margarita TaxID=4874 RepID=A0ABN7VRP9_GIGMA|nr:31286_t:CDS:2 [Gigaspora margarita]